MPVVGVTGVTILVQVGHVGLHPFGRYLLGLVHEAEELEEELSQNPAPCFEHLISREVGAARFTARCVGDSGDHLRNESASVGGAQVQVES